MMSSQAKTNLPAEVIEGRKRFTSELIEEHIDEVSFLYLRRATLLKDYTLGWGIVADIEKRMLAHIDALLKQRAAVENGDLSDPERVYTLLRIYCRCEDFNRVCTIISSISPAVLFKKHDTHASFNDNYWNDEAAIPLINGLPKPLSNEQNASNNLTEEDEEDDTLDELIDDDDTRNALMQAVQDALIIDMPVSFKQRFNELALDKDLMLTDILWRIYGHRRWSAPSESLVIPEQPSAGYCFAVGRLQDNSAFMRLVRANHSDNEAISCAAAIGILRLKNRLLLKIQKPDYKLPWLATAIGLAGAFDNVKEILSIPIDEWSPATTIALGLLGCIQAVKPLIEALADEDLAAMASLALNLITGAGLQEEVFIADETEDDELLDEELEERQNHKESDEQQDDGSEGEYVTRLSQKPEQWQQWWSENQQKMQPELRWRCGKQYCPEVLVDFLCDQTSTPIVRDLVIEELAIRYAIDAAFEPNAPVVEQLSRLEQLKHTVAKRGQKFKPGGWYFAGELIRDTP
ncbi:MAG: hypothetical protein JW841_08730 [Deltaproteobacteria bacterium]|nr:hypothetical protein [Deltaproteobacteria bacterium]